MSAHEHSVWVVDDSPLDGSRTADALRSTYEVLLFGDGSSLLEYLSSHAPPDVLVLDWVMPGISGPDVCRFIRSPSNAASQSIAILLLTSQQHTEQIVEGLSSGANDYLSKPYAEEELKARVAALIRSQELLRRAEKAERALRAVLDSAPDALFVLDATGQVSYANAEAERAFHLGGRARGRSVSELVPTLVLDRADIEPASSRTLPDVVLEEEVFSPVIKSFSTGGGLGDMTLSLRNVTERRKIDARRLDFYAIVAHDLRSPLNAVLLRTEVMLRGARGQITDAIRGDLNNIQKNVHTLVALINDFLDLARLESPSYTVESEPLDLLPLLNSLIDDMKPLLEAAGHTLVVSVPPESCWVVGDDARLGQVLTNLLSNAIKYTPRGGQVSVSLTRSNDEVDARISDTGPGIDAELLPTLSQRYVRAKRQKATGTGLGLMIVREILEAHGSTLQIESEPGRGSSFWFRLPGATAPSP